jgi:SAM-dependent methyltransferase
MRQDVGQLANFYASPRGAAAGQMTRRRLEALWPSLHGLDVLAFGYPGPVLDDYPGQARRLILAMPDTQGASPWPEGGANQVAMMSEERLALREALFDRVLLLHALEESEAPRRLLREIWRVMAPEGRLVVVAASRRGLWAGADSTPFGHGRPFTRAQLETLLRDAMFEPAARANALYVPPLDWSLLFNQAEAWERVGERFWPRFGGLVLVEAVKRLEARPPGSLAPVTSRFLRPQATKAMNVPPKQDRVALGLPATSRRDTGRNA